MSDYEKLNKLLEVFGINSDNDVKNEVYIEVGSLNAKLKVCGYEGFYVNFMFDNNGKFKKMEIAE